MKLLNRVIQTIELYLKLNLYVLYGGMQILLAMNVSMEGVKGMPAEIIIAADLF